jgi:hypothetical protein
MMLLVESNYKDRINSMTSEDWQPVLDLISIVENTDEFYTMIEFVSEEEKCLHTASLLSE